MFDFGYFEEKQLGKPYDLGLLRRLYPYALTYRTHFTIAIVMVVFITMLELAIPYVTKVAIDRYIVPAEETADGGRSRNGDTRYLWVDPGDPAAAAVMARHPDLFETRMAEEGARARIAFADLKLLDRTELARLRGEDIRGVSRMALIFLGLILAQFVFNFIQTMILEYAAQYIMRDLRLSLFSHIQSRSVAFFNRNSVGRLVTRATNDVQNIYELFTSVITFVFKDMFLLIGIAIVLMTIDLKLALVTLLVIPLVLMASFHFARQARDAFRVLKIKLAEINTRFSEMVGGIRVIQACRWERENYARFKSVNHENYQAGMRQIRVFAVFMPVIELLGSVVIAVVIFYGGAGALEGRVTLGALVAFISYMKMFFRPIRDLAEKYNILQNAMASAERIFQILDDEDRIASPPPERAAPLNRVRTLDFADVSFAYIPGEPVLRNLDFSMRAGQFVAIVGPTGSGKTSIINLIMRFYDPTEGVIRINGRDLRDIPLARMRARMALVTQDPFLFSGTIRSNIALPEAGLSDAQMADILASANCKWVIDRLPGGLDYRLTEGGATLSSGERQLISIARAFARDPELILLDEATSYIDSQTESIIQEALGRLMRDRTTILVAHRLGTARGADRIMVVHKGRIVETGPHAELMARQGFYYRLNMLNGG